MNTKLFYIGILLLLLVFGILWYCKCNQSQKSLILEKFTMEDSEYRASNTFLVPVKNFESKIDQLKLPANVVDNFNEWIEKGLVSPVKDQMRCGGCWGFATVSSLADRLMIATNGKWDPPFGLSEQQIISCGGQFGMKFYNGCNGGLPQYAIDALTLHGIPMDVNCSESGCGGRGGSAPQNVSTGSGKAGVVNPSATCKSGNVSYASVPYTWWQTGCDANSGCSLAPASTCSCSIVQKQMNEVDTAGIGADKFKTIGKAHTYTTHDDKDAINTVDLWPNISPATIAKNVERMKKAIYWNGPITVGYRVYADFYKFWPTASPNNYYKYDGRSRTDGGHAVTIVGWKKIGNVPVWIIKNSWGSDTGYGFPNGPKRKNPLTGKMEPRYPGGFWNHAMGINDSFIESNSCGAHPDLTVPAIKSLMTQHVPKNWYETTTLRAIHEAESSGKQLPKPIGPIVVPPHPHHKPIKPTPTPIGPIVVPPHPHPIGPIVPTPVPHTSKFKIVNAIPSNTTPQSISEFYKMHNSAFILGTLDEKTSTAVMNELDATKTEYSNSDVTELVQKLMKTVSGYLVLGLRGSTNNYYYIFGDPANWGVYIKYDFVKKSATLENLAHNLFIKLQTLNYYSPVIMASKK